MTNEQSTQTISDLIGKIATLGACEGYRTNLEFIDGELSFTAKPNAPFTYKDGEVHMEPEPVDYEAIGLDALKIDGTIFDPRKHLGDTFDEAVKSWSDDIASASAEHSDNLKVDVESIKVDSVLTPDDVAQAYLETIGEATCPSSDIVISIGTLNVNVG